MHYYRFYLEKKSFCHLIIDIIKINVAISNCILYIVKTYTDEALFLQANTECYNVFAYTNSLATLGEHYVRLFFCSAFILHLLYFLK